jgi:putative SOS response-associated peptidase YedK
MCGRFAFAPKIDNIVEEIKIIDRDNTLKISYNFSPGMEISTLDSKYEVKNMIWGLIPHWSKDLAIGSKLYNARCETAHEKPSFRNAFRNRCLIPATGFYEWQKIGRHRVPHFIKHKNDKTIYFAGICDSVIFEEKTINSVTILTTEPNDIIKKIHNRMPVILDTNNAEQWLKSTKEEILNSNIFTPYPSNELSTHRVSDRIQDTSLDSIELIENIENTLF